MKYYFAKWNGLLSPLHPANVGHSVRSSYTLHTFNFSQYLNVYEIMASSRSPTRENRHVSTNKKPKRVHSTQSLEDRRIKGKERTAFASILTRTVIGSTQAKQISK